ncbi:hypothetical protein HID58_040063 [Brassica napus]|uniref:Uncharacterized protein n=1 Tax=Brassica napus TaxID=3708 RepID=A0ABQ8B6Z6_BRANA|nr:hypothetical protein HID58_040063 [Brassica napus]
MDKVELEHSNICVDIIVSSSYTPYQIGFDLELLCLILRDHELT